MIGLFYAYTLNKINRFAPPANEDYAPLKTRARLDRIGYLVEANLAPNNSLHDYRELNNPIWSLQAQRARQFITNILIFGLG